MRGEIHGLQLGMIEIVDMLAGQAYLAEKPVVPEHGNFIATELHVGFDAIEGIFQRLVESRAGVFRRLLVGATVSEDHGFGHGVFCINPNLIWQTVSNQIATTKLINKSLHRNSERG